MLKRLYIVAAAITLILAFAFIASEGQVAAPRRLAVPFADSGEKLPVLDGNLVMVSNERYDAFASSVTLSTGEILTAYVSSTTHTSGDPLIKLRRSYDGVAWSKAYTLPLPASFVDTGAGVGGLAVETAAQGGRVYLAAVRYTTTGALESWITTSDDGGQTWTPLRLLPAPHPGFAYSGSLLVLADGSVMWSLYTRPSSTALWEVRYYRSTNRGDSWNPFGGVTIANRHATEPSMVQLDDGRIMSFIRSDAAGVYYDYIYTTVSSSSSPTWTTPSVSVVHATGAPNVDKLADGRLLLSYRGYENIPENTVDNKFPLRMAIYKANGAGYQSKIDVIGDTRRWLYGNVVTVDGKLRLIGSLEGTLGQCCNAATVYSWPLKLVSLPAY